MSPYTSISSMHQVFAARYRGQPVAVKNLLTMQAHGSTDDMLTRLESVIAEVKSLKRCNHPSIVHCCTCVGMGGCGHVWVGVATCGWMDGWTGVVYSITCDSSTSAHTLTHKHKNTHTHIVLSPSSPQWVLWPTHGPSSCCMSCVMGVTCTSSCQATRPAHGNGQTSMYGVVHTLFAITMLPIC